MGVETFTIVCAWCRRVVKMDAAAAHVSHTICPICLEWTLRHSAADIDPNVPAAIGRLPPPDGYFGNVFKH